MSSPGPMKLVVDLAVTAVVAVVVLGAMGLVTSRWDFLTGGIPVALGAPLGRWWVRRSSQPEGAGQ
ncbi:MULTISPECIES: hypothetical protein [unclassified Streptomyces]|uniref:hypothetical protein n=1 Tax=unclassified Streptomyces TaxID=2593676 RepID=UPI002E1987C3|nr:MULTISPECIES: hypothetical protein [unclassified Streptomyces]